MGKWYSRISFRSFLYIFVNGVEMKQENCFTWISEIYSIPLCVIPVVIDFNEEGLHALIFGHTYYNTILLNMVLIE